MFPLLRMAARAQQRRNILCRADARTRLRRPLCTPSKFKRGKHRRRLCHADARDPCKLRAGHREDLVQPRLSKTRHNAACKIEHILPRTPCAQQDREQLRIAQRLCAAHNQTFTRQLPRRQLTQVHPHPPS